jgi:hypothetical protein
MPLSKSSTKARVQAQISAHWASFTAMTETSPRPVSTWFALVWFSLPVAKATSASDWLMPASRSPNQ